jgi:hypothetical protein
MRRGVLAASRPRVVLIVGPLLPHARDEHRQAVFLPKRRAAAPSAAARVLGSDRMNDYGAMYTPATPPKY